MRKSETPSLPLLAIIAVFSPLSATSIDTVQSFWDSRPCNIRHSPALFGSQQYFEEVEARKYFVEPHIIDFADFPTYRGKKVLDVGCGIGTIGSGFSRCGADYTGFELSEKSLEIAKKRFQVLGHSGRFIHGNAEELASYFPDDTFDLIFSFGVIHHSPDPKKIVREMRKILSPNGEIKIMVYAKNSWKQTMIDAGFDQPEAQSGCPIAFSYSKEEINDLLEGFDILSIEQDHIFPYMVMITTNYANYFAILHRVWSGK